MELENIRPILSGLIGGSVAIWIGTKMSKRLPTDWEGIPASVLLRRNRIAIYLSNIMVFGGFMIALYLYKKGIFEKSDFRGIGVGLGFGFTSAFLVLPIYSILNGRKIGEAFVAYSLSQKIPSSWLFSIMAGGLIVFLVSLASIYA